MATTKKAIAEAEQAAEIKETIAAPTTEPGTPAVTLDELESMDMNMFDAEETESAPRPAWRIRARKQREPQQDDPPLAAKGDELRRDRRRSDPDNNKLAEQLPAEDPRIFASQCSISRANGRPFGGLIKFI